MNERIRELAEQAELNATLLFNKDKLEKFAELIVRECVSVIGEENYGMLTGKANCTKIKRHFGVSG